MKKNAALLSAAIFLGIFLFAPMSHAGHRSHRGFEKFALGFGAGVLTHALIAPLQATAHVATVHAAPPPPPVTPVYVVPPPPPPPVVVYRPAPRRPYRKVVHHHHYYAQKPVHRHHVKKYHGHGKKHQTRHDIRPRHTRFHQ